MRASRNTSASSRRSRDDQVDDMSRICVRERSRVLGEVPSSPTETAWVGRGVSTKVGRWGCVWGGDGKGVERGGRETYIERFLQQLGDPFCRKRLACSWRLEQRM